MQHIEYKVQPTVLPDGRLEFKVEAPEARGVFHIVAGTEEWTPTPKELDDLASIFLQASEDPLGAVVSTRRGVEVKFFPLPPAP